MAYDAGAFKKANDPGRGSTIGDFVPGKNGGWVPRDHPDAMAPTTTPTDGGIMASSPSAETPPGGGAGAEVDTSGLSAAMAGLRSAATPPEAPDMITNLAGPSPSNPNLGQRIPPISMRQLAMMLPRIY